MGALGSFVPVRIKLLLSGKLFVENVYDDRKIEICCRFFTRRVKTFTRHVKIFTCLVNVLCVFCESGIAIPLHLSVLLLKTIAST